MLELKSKIKNTLEQYESEPARTLLESELWFDVRKGVKNLIAELEIKGQKPAAYRVDREYSMLAQELRKSIESENPPKIQSNLVLWDCSQEFFCTLDSLSRFQGEIDRQYKISDSLHKDENPKPSRRPGRERSSLEKAKRQVKILMDWATRSEMNKKDSSSMVSKEQFAKSYSITLEQLNAYQSLYRKYRAKGLLPDDPRDVDQNKLEELFE